MTQPPHCGYCQATIVYLNWKYSRTRAITLVKKNVQMQDKIKIRNLTHRKYRGQNPSTPLSMPQWYMLRPTTSLHENMQPMASSHPQILSCTMVMLSPNFGGKEEKTAYSIPRLIKLRSLAPNVRCWLRTSQHFPLQRGTKLYNSLSFMKTRCKIRNNVPYDISNEWSGYKHTG